MNTNTDVRSSFDNTPLNPVLFIGQLSDITTEGS